MSVYYFIALLSVELSQEVAMISIFYADCFFMDVIDVCLFMIVLTLFVCYFCMLACFCSFRWLVCLLAVLLWVCSLFLCLFVGQVINFASTELQTQKQLSNN